MDRIRLNPLEQIRSLWPEADIDHLTFDPTVRDRKNSIGYAHRHDGTKLFTYELIMKTLWPLVQSAWKLEVGWLRLASVVDLENMHGMRERTRLCVRRVVDR